MKDHELYQKFIYYLESQVRCGSISSGKFSILKMSSDYFQTFIKKYERDELFQKRVIENYKSETRDKKIDDIFNDFDL
jgi:hypothetical protein